CFHDGQRGHARGGCCGGTCCREGSWRLFPRVCVVSGVPRWSASGARPILRGVVPGIVRVLSWCCHRAVSVSGWDGAIGCGGIGAGVAPHRLAGAELAVAAAGAGRLVGGPSAERARWMAHLDVARAVYGLIIVIAVLEVMELHPPDAGWEAPELL